MKKVLFVLLASGFMFTASAQVDSSMKSTTTTTSTHKYYYYPGNNTYYDEPSNTYWYRDSASSQWMSRQDVPTTWEQSDTTRYLIDYTGNDPWTNNESDLKKYKAKDNGKIKMKTDDTKVKVKPQDGKVKVKDR